MGEGLIPTPNLILYLVPVPYICWREYINICLVGNIGMCIRQIKPRNLNFKI